MPYFGSGGGFPTTPAPSWGSYKTPQQALLERAAQIAYLRKLAGLDLKKNPEPHHGILDAIAHNPISNFMEKTVGQIADVATASAGAVMTGVTPWWNLVSTGHPYAHGAGKAIDTQADAMASSILGEPVKKGDPIDEYAAKHWMGSELLHPLRDPGLVAIDLFTLGQAGASGVARGAAARRAFSTKLAEERAKRVTPPPESGGATAIPDPFTPPPENPGYLSRHYGTDAQGRLFDQPSPGPSSLAQAQQGMLDVQRRQSRAPMTALEPYQAPAEQMTVHTGVLQNVIPRLLSEGRWKVADWEGALRDAGLPVDSAVELRDAFAARLGAPLTPKLNPNAALMNKIMEKYPDRTPPGAKPWEDAARTQLQLPGMETSPTRPYTVPEAPTEAAPRTMPFEQKPLFELTGRQVRRYVAMKGKVYDITNKAELAALQAVRATEPLPPRMHWLDEAQAVEMRANRQAAERSARPSGEPSMRPIERTPADVPKTVEPPYSPPLTRAQQADLRITTAEPQRYELRVSQGALKYRTEASAKIQSLTKQLRQLHGKRASLEREGLGSQAKAVSDQIVKLEEQQAALKQRVSELKPYTVHDTQLGVRGVAGAEKSWGTTKGALKTLARLNREHGPVYPRESLRDRLAPYREVPPRDAGVVAPEAAAPPAANAERAGRPSPSAPLEHTPLSPSTAERSPFPGVPLRRGRLFPPLGSELHRKFTQSAPEGTQADFISFENGKAVGNYFSGKKGYEKVDLAEAPAAKPTTTPEQVADQVAIANDDLIQRERPIVGDKSTGNKGGKTLRIPGADASAAEIARSLSWAKKNPEFEQYVPQLEEALRQAKGAEPTHGASARPATVGKAGAAGEGLGARELGLGPRAVREELGLPNTKEGQAQARAISREIHPKVVAWAKKGGSKGELLAILKPAFGSKAAALVKKILPLVGAAGAGFITAGPKGAAMGVIPTGGLHLSPEVIAATREAIRAFQQPLPKGQTMRVHYGITESGRVVPLRGKSVVRSPELKNGKIVLGGDLQASLNGEKLVKTTYADIPLSNSPLFRAWQKNVQIPLLEKYPDKTGFVKGSAKALITGRRSFGSKIRFEEQEIGRIVQSVMKMHLLPDAPKPGESAVSYATRLGEWTDSANMLAKIMVLFLKPAYIPANMMGQMFLTAVDHSWSPLSLARSVGIQRELFGKAVRKELNVVALGKGEGAPKIENMDAFVRAQKIRAVMGGGLVQAYAHEVQGRGLGNRINRVYERSAYEMGRLLDTPFRDNAFINEAIRQGYDTAEKIGKLVDDVKPLHPGEGLDNFIERIAKENPDFVNIARNANRNLIDYGRMGRAEKNLLRRIVFFYPWVKGATIYGGRMAAEHPFQLAAQMQIGNVQHQLNEQQLGPLPSYEEGVVKVGEQDVPGLGTMPLIVNPTAASVLGTPADVLKTGLAALTGGKEHPLSDLAGPLPTLAAAAAYRIDPTTGAEYPAGMSIPRILTKQVEKFPAPLNLLRKVDQAQQIASGEKDASKILLPETAGQAFGRWVGGVTPMSLNTKEAASRAFAEKTSVAGRRQQAVYKMQRYQEQYFKEFKRVGILPAGAKKLPAVLRQAFAARAERDAELKLLQDSLGHRLNPLEGLQGELELLVRKGKISQGVARSILAQLSGMSESAIQHQRRQLRNAYFGGQVLSAYAAMGRAAGADLPELR